MSRGLPCLARDEALCRRLNELTRKALTGRATGRRDRNQRNRGHHWSQAGGAGLGSNWDVVQRGRPEVAVVPARHGLALYRI